MKIGELYKEKGTLLSFEIFPPKQESSLEIVYKTIEDLRDLSPDFISVTYRNIGSFNLHCIKSRRYRKNSGPIT